MLVIVLIAARVLWEWCFFARFMDDDSWLLRVADRSAAGEHIYTDFGWVYGPLPVWAVGALFRLSRTVAWDALLDALLCVTAVGAVWSISARLAGHSAGAWITAWTILLGAPIGLISHQLTTYTTAVAWGTAMSLLATATALAWVQTATPLALVATATFSAGAVLSKPEFGLAGLCVFGTALWLRRPPQRVLMAVAACVLAAGVIATLRVNSSTWFAWWRGYSGYDLIDTKMVAIVVPDRVAGAVALGAGFALCLWSRTLGAVVALFGSICAAILFTRDVMTRPALHWLLPQVLRFAWAGVIPWLVCIGWLARRSRALSSSPAFWVVWVFAIAVNLRFFLYGDFCAAAAGPAAALACVAVRQRLVPRPTRVGMLALAVVLLASLQTEIAAILRPRGAARVDTPLGSIRVPPRTAADIAVIRPHLDTAPSGALFVSGAGPAWYVLSGRRNPTHFDAMLEGMGTTRPEVVRLLEDLRAHPPTLVIVENRLGATSDYSHARMWAALGKSYRFLASNRRCQLFEADSTATP